MPSAALFRSSFSALCVAILVGGCGALGADRAIDEATEVVARLPCAPDLHAPAANAAKVAPCQASNKTVFFAVSAREYLSEARRRAHHGDHAQAERFAVLARKAAEEAMRSQDGQ